MNRDDRWPLHPAGAVRAGLAVDLPPDGRDVFRALASVAQRSDLGDDALVFAEELLAGETFLDGNQRTALAYVVLALLTAVGQGATRLPLDPKGPLRDLVGGVARAAGKRLTTDALVKVVDTLAGGHFATIIGTPGQRRPLIVDDHCLYVHRDHQREVELAAALRARWQAPGLPPTALGDAPVPLSDEQAAAVALALRQRLAVIVGGPGTGKTAIAVAIVRGLQARGVRDIVLAAPTGRAAQRLGEAVAAGLPAGTPDEQRPAAMTLHRLLGAHRGGFRHGPRAPLPVGAVLVDEASMMDLRLCAALLAATPADAHLVLLGDADQLPSVEAGQVLADIVTAAEPAAASRPLVARLTRSFRMDPRDPDGAEVLAVAQAVRAGAIDALLGSRATLLRPAPADLDAAAAAAPRGVTLIAPAAGAAGVTRRAVLDGWFARLTDDRYWQTATREHRFDPATGSFAPAAAAALEALLARLAASRILTATRSLPTGAVALSAYLHDRLASASVRLDGDLEFVPGEPVMMRANDHARGLWNGDLGVIARVVDGAEAGDRGRWRAVFRRDGQLVPVPLDALRSRLERAWAITVHKSQGAEVDDATIILPDDDTPILTRELVYTAITRARRGVRLVGSRDVLAAAIGRRAVRTTGLVARLTGPT